jgi:hypothetical protein
MEQASANSVGHFLAIKSKTMSGLYSGRTSVNSGLAALWRRWPKLRALVNAIDHPDCADRLTQVSSKNTKEER